MFGRYLASVVAFSIGLVRRYSFRYQKKLLRGPDEKMVAGNHDLNSETSEVGAGARPELTFSYIWDDFQLIASNYA